MDYGSSVGRGHYCPLPPEELYVTLSRHTAQIISKSHFVGVTGTGHRLGNPDLKLFDHSLTLVPIYGLPMYRLCKCRIHLIFICDHLLAIDLL